MREPEVVIVGAGLAGLCCGRRLFQAGTTFRILEASDGVGGRVRTDVVDGFRLDRGFQVFLTAYPEARRVLDYGSLGLRRFEAGAIVRWQGQFHHLADPRHRPLTALRGLATPIGTFRDKCRVIWLRDRVHTGSIEQQWQKPERPALELLRSNAGFTDAMIDRFFRPFLGGVFFDRDLATSSRMVRFVYRMFSSGDVAVPAEGMQAIPRQIAEQLPPASVRLNSAVTAVEPGRVTLASGERLTAKAVVIATEGPAAVKLLGGAIPPVNMRSTVTLHYAAEQPVVGSATLVLDGDGTGPVNTLVEMSAAAPSYAPPGQTLLAASVVGDPAEDAAALDQRARFQLASWYGPTVSRWRLLRVDRIREALPDMTAGALEPPQRPVRVQPGLYVCGDHRDNGSIDGAMTSGWRTAQEVLADVSDQ
jgi:phytoene dehydrogenase-like protein